MPAASSSSPVYFWRDTEPSTGYLSQWYPCAFTDDANPSIIYRSAEHYMMYHKAQLFADHAVAAEILAAPHPRTVKALGRKVAGFSDAVWKAHREAIVRRGNLLKFTRPADVRDGRWLVKLHGTEEEVSIRELLLRTGERELVEASPMDRIWGIGFGAAKAGVVGREKWGLNLLGKALMDVREQLRRDGESGGKGAKEAENAKQEDGADQK
ncbi:0145b5db-60e5-4ff1-8392-a770bfda7eb5 [Thermothielavioides terrestris]|uniref:0145b5db-60e5-4ff1-8392-a770bfda7eb5 n=1 Tax=Thermothielavioides terrestris TaxID=2587410 RepID=A0A3S4ESM2_9PEZI|nr:0145b5db-60e5-4ff1-8392-a770bfda7eb5 [Thermothielavioides terrestris]